MCAHNNERHGIRRLAPIASTCTRQFGMRPRQRLAQVVNWADGAFFRTGAARAAKFAREAREHEGARVFRPPPSRSPRVICALGLLSAAAGQRSTHRRAIVCLDDDYLAQVGENERASKPSNKTASPRRQVRASNGRASCRHLGHREHRPRRLSSQIKLVPVRH